MDAQKAPPSLAASAAPHPSLAQASKLWGKIGLLSFGGPAAQIALMHQLIVEQKRWMNEKDFLNALSFCMLLPGPEAMQLATYAGWRQHGIKGGLVAGGLFILPGALVMLVLGVIYAIAGEVLFIQAIFLGVKAAVLVVVLEALLRISKKALKGPLLKTIAALAFIGIFFFNIPYPLIVLMAAIVGFLGSGKRQTAEQLSTSKPESFSRLLITVFAMLCIWLVPLLVIHQVFAVQILTEIGLFFSKLAVVTFGGAYAVLAYMGQDVVNHWGWLTAGEMMDGLGLAETTPGPLILVTQFVGFLAAFREGGIGLGIAGAAISLWATFVPCFLWIFAGAPYIDWIGAQPRLSAALAAISAAVVGVILNLSIWFALHVLFKEVSAQQLGPLTLWRPELASIDWRMVSLTAICALLAFVWHWSIGRILIVSACLGVVMTML